MHHSFFKSLPNEFKNMNNYNLKTVTCWQIALHEHSNASGRYIDVTIHSTIYCYPSTYMNTIHKITEILD